MPRAPTWGEYRAAMPKNFQHCVTILKNQAIQFRGQILRGMVDGWNASPTWLCCACGKPCSTTNHVQVLTDRIASKDSHLEVAAYHHECVVVTPVTQVVAVTE